MSTPSDDCEYRLRACRNESATRLRAQDQRIGELEREIAEAREMALEEAAQRFDGLTFGPYAHPSIAIRELITARALPVKP